MSMRVMLRRGEAAAIARAIQERHGGALVCPITIRRVAAGRVSRWSGEAELVREELILRGRCPRGYLPEERRDRWSDTYYPEGAS